MKAAVNAVQQLSTLDGWWAEGYDGENGWAIPSAPGGDEADAADAAHLYRLLEDEIVPLFYTQDQRGIPLGWVEKMKHALRAGIRQFTADRMVRQYVAEHYVPAIRRELSGDDPPTA
jgi:starch phosphorylase